MATAKDGSLPHLNQGEMIYDFDELLKYVFNELSEEERADIENILEKDKYLLEMKNGIVKLKEKFNGNQEAVISYLQQMREDIKQDLFPPKK